QVTQLGSSRHVGGRDGGVLSDARQDERGEDCCRCQYQRESHDRSQRDTPWAGCPRCWASRQRLLPRVDGFQRLRGLRLVASSQLGQPLGSDVAAVVEFADGPEQRVALLLQVGQKGVTVVRQWIGLGREEQGQRYVGEGYE